MERYDIAIIGTGPAGLEAAVTAKIRNKKILLIGGNSLSLKVEKAHTVKNYLGLPDVSGEQMQMAFQKHLDQMKIVITQEKVNSVYAMGKYFAIQGHKEMYEADTVILACGLSAAWCAPCKMLAPVLEEVSEELAESAAFYNVDVDENPDLAQQYDIVSIPALLVLKNGDKQDVQVGFQPKDAIISFIKAAI